MLLPTLSLAAQQLFPLSAKEDKEGIMSKAYWKIWNPKVQAKIDHDIEQNRKADATVKLPGAKAGTNVKVEQVQSDFIFGAHIFNFDQLGTKERNDRYKNLFGTLFNRATVAFYWKTFETREGRKRYREEYWDTEDWWNHIQNPKDQVHWRRPSTDKVVDFLSSRGVAIHGHPMIWGNPKWQRPAWLYKLLTPEEKKEMDKLVSKYPDTYDLLSEAKYSDGWKKITSEELNKKLKAFGEKLNNLYEMRIRNLISHYGNRISSWDVVNESATDFAHGKMIPGQQLMKSDYGLMPGDYTYKAFKTAQDCFPANVWKNINDYWTGPEYGNQIKNLLSRGARIDIAGSQMHLFNPRQCLDIAAGKNIQTPMHVWKLMSSIASAGVPICLSEITITSPTTDHKGQMIQAVIAQNLYRIWFSIKEMKAITWWNIVDDCGAPGEPSVSGLFTRDMQPKLSYYALNNLINNEWKTRLLLKAGKDGSVKFRGFRGKYHITYTTDNGKEETIDYHVK
jgi:GH35 family endo-1,4-beta-xylanase